MMIEPTESESQAELDRSCEAVIAIREEIRAAERETGDRQDNPDKHASHTGGPLIADRIRPHSKEQVFFPTAAARTDKYCLPVARVGQCER